MYWSMISFLTSSSSLTPTSLRVEPTTFRVWVKESQLIIGQKTEATKLDLVAWSPSSPCQLGHHHLDQNNLDHHCHQYRHCCHHCWHQVKNLIAWLSLCFILEKSWVALYSDVCEWVSMSGIGVTRPNLHFFQYMSHSQMLGKFEYTLPAKFWRLVGCTEMLSW